MSRPPFTEAIILAGGLGTRLRSAVPDLPKCMAPILAKPFIGYLVDYLLQQGMGHIIFSLGYKHEFVEQYLRTQFGALYYSVVVEQEPQGTGGALLLAMGKARQQAVYVLNGDSFLNADLADLAAVHQRLEPDCTIAVKPMNEMSRYGEVVLDDDQRISAFLTHSSRPAGMINAGLYLLNKSAFLQAMLQSPASFERDYLQQAAKQGRVAATVQDKYFIDIGIPEDYERAQTELIKNITTNA